MKAERIVFFSLLCVCLLGGLLTGERAFFLVLFIQLGILLLCIALSVWTVYNFSYVQTVDREELVKGETLKLHLRIHNDMPYPFTMMRVHISAITVQEDVSYCFALPAHGQIEFNPHFSCVFSGRSEVGMSRVEIEDVFGLTHLTFNMLRLPYYRKRPVLIYPRVHELSRLNAYALDEKNFSGTSFNQSGDGDHYAGVREYRQGDALKRIHWKISFRTQTLHTRTYEAATKSHCIVWLDPFLYGAEGEPARVYADVLCEAAATIAYHVLAGGRTVRLCRTDDPAGGLHAGSMKEFVRIHRFLALFEHESGQGQQNACRACADALSYDHGAGAAYLLTLGNARLLSDFLQSAALPPGGATVFAVNENGRRGVSNAGSIRSVTARPGDNLVAVLEEML